MKALEHTWSEGQPLAEGQKREKQTKIQVPGLVMKWQLAQTVRREQTWAEGETDTDLTTLFYQNWRVLYTVCSFFNAGTPAKNMQ